jgi:ABC-type branched-subunit amino acid transport system permease subunit/ABC-type branched-subunit amino acid transport system ATPase component
VINTMLALTYSNDIVWRGIVNGLVYALVALGLVLVFRASGVINFAQGQIGAFGGYAMAILFVNYDIAYGVSFPLAVASGAILGALTELLVVRRLFRQPRLLLFVATLGVSQLILVLQLQLPAIETFTRYPTPISGRWDVPGLDITLRGDQLVVLIVVPILVGVLAFLLQRTRFGLAVRSAADNPNAASLSGIRVRAVSTQVWVLAGVLSAVSALLIGPIQNLDAGSVQQALGPNLLLLALTAAMFGRLASFPLALVGGVVVGVVDQLVLANSRGTPGLNKLVLFVLLVVLVLVRGRASRAEDQAWALTGQLRAARAELARHPLARWSRWGGVTVLLAIGLGAPLLLDKPTDYLEYSQVLIFIIVAVSATMLTGWAGQLSLGQFAFAAVGAYLTIYYAQQLNYLVALGLGVIWGVGIAIIIGIPALRIRGLYLAVVTLGFALMVEGWLLGLDRLNNAPGGFGAQLSPPPDVGPWSMRDKRAYYYMCLAFTIVVVLLVTRIRRTGIGRTLIAVRDNEVTASAYTVSPTRAKLIAFAISGGIAALAGGLLALANSTTQPSQFPPTESLLILSIAVVGGISSVTGAVLGTLLIIGIPTVFDGTDEVQLFASAIGMLVIVLYFPEGLIGLVHRARDYLLDWVARRTNWQPRRRVPQTGLATLSRTSAVRTPNGAQPLRTDGLTVAFGGLVAVDGVSIDVGQGDIVGLIGTNGAGKTTFMNAVSGLVRSKGHVELFGARVDRTAQHARARLGVGRGFQNAKLFATLTVRETLMVALEARERSLLVPSMLAVPPSPFAERRKRKEADEIIGYFGLDRYADSLLSELSTGTRRVVELGALMALDTKLMLLDEPTAGVAQRETEAFGPLIKQVQRELGSSILLIEHDMPMVMSISDRIYCLEAGAVIAEGTPEQVRADPLVIASYLGTDPRAIERSGQVSGS